LKDFSVVELKSHTEEELNLLITKFSAHFSKLSELTKNSAFFTLHQEVSENFSLFSSEKIHQDQDSLHVFVDTLPNKNLFNPALQIYLHALKILQYGSPISILLGKDFLAKKQ
jgi:hypothetical protein